MSLLSDEIKGVCLHAWKGVTMNDIEIHSSPSAFASPGLFKSHPNPEIYGRQLLLHEETEL